MSTTRKYAIPNANSPQLLARLLDMVGRGVRTTRGLQETLGVEARTVQYYTQAGEWLGFMEVTPECQLTPLGLEYVYAGRDRPQVYARAIWNHPFAKRVLELSEGELPPLKLLSAAIQEAEPTMAPSTVQRRASALRGLLAPAVGKHKPKVGTLDMQLALPFGDGVPLAAAPRLPRRDQTEYSPDAYRFLLAELLDHGELTFPQIRALLDRTGAHEAPLGGYVDMALARGDAQRLDDRLCVTADAARRPELVDTTNSIILSDPVYRQYLRDVLEAADSQDARIRRDRMARRFRAWDQRLFGHRLKPETIHRDLRAVLLDRPLESFPTATRTAPPCTPVSDFFLDIHDQAELPPLAICLPPYLALVQGGLPLVNRHLKQARTGSTTRPPDLASVPALFHGGIVHPSEPLPSSVPDLRTLRMRLLLASPYPALLTAMLLWHRRRPEDVQLVRKPDGWCVFRGSERLGRLLPLMDAYFRSRGWVVSRRPTGGLDEATLLQVLESLDMASVVGQAAVLSERFFGQLRSEAEELEVYERLQPLARHFGDYLHDRGTDA